MNAAFCPKCNTVYPGDAKFCGFDKSPLAHKQVGEGTQLDLKVCPACGSTFPSRANNCSEDGQLLKPFSVPLDGAYLVLESASAQRPKRASIPAKMAVARTMRETGDETGTVLTISKNHQLGMDVLNNFRAKEGTKLDLVAQPRATTPGLLVEKPVGSVLNAITGEIEKTLEGRLVDGKYQVEEMIGEGGMAVLYRAKQVAMERDVVLKVIHTALAYKESAIERFERECKYAAKISHPNVVSVFDFGFITKRQPYLVMELIKGTPLAIQIDEKGRMPLDLSARLVTQICGGLEEIHSVGLIHRDLKPDNIILQERSERPDWVKIVDFGIAHFMDDPDEKRLTQMGRIIGTPEYMAPEQFRLRTLDARADIYALGILMFEALTGDVPFYSEDIVALVTAHSSEEPALISSLRPDVRPNSKLDAVIAKCLAKAPDDRYQSVNEVSVAFESAIRETLEAR